MEIKLAMFDIEILSEKNSKLKPTLKRINVPTHFFYGNKSSNNPKLPTINHKQSQEMDARYLRGKP